MAPARHSPLVLAERGHALPAKIQEWRGIAKLKSTYTDALQRFADPVTDRVHTSFNLAGTVTGRLSSSDPNLQNIPIKSEDGQRIRRAFIAKEGHKLVVNQIELRVLARIAPIPEMLAAFAAGEDIHAATASRMFKVPMEGMTKATCSRAKTINFGIIYGVSEGGLAKQLGTSKREAMLLLLKYNKQYPSILLYMDNIKAFARKTGYVTTILGRKCHYPDICSKDSGISSYSERGAVNATIQGSAGDIIQINAAASALHIELRKPVDKGCGHCQPGRGRSIYESRPAICRSFMCEWLLNPDMPDFWKPSEANMLITLRSCTCRARRDL